MKVLLCALSNVQYTPKRSYVERVGKKIGPHPHRLDDRDPRADPAQGRALEAVHSAPRRVPAL